MSGPTGVKPNDGKDRKIIKNLFPYVSQLHALKKFEKFIKGVEYIIVHRSMNFETICFLLEKTRDSPISDGIEKVDSQKFYKSILWQESRERKYGMDTIVKYYGDERTKAAHKSGAQGALVDVENLCSVSTGGLLDRFRDWLMFESSDVKVIMRCSQESEDSPRQVLLWLDQSYQSINQLSDIISHQ